MYEIGSSVVSNIVPGAVTVVPEGKEGATELPVTMLPRQPDKEDAAFTTYGPQEETTEENNFSTETTSETSTEYPTSSPVPETTTIAFTEMKLGEQDFGKPVQVRTEYPESVTASTPTYTDPHLGQTSNSTPSVPQYLEEVTTPNPVSQPSESISTVSETSEIPQTTKPQFSSVAPRLPESDPVESFYTPEPWVSPIPPVFPESNPVESYYTPEPRFSPIAPVFPESNPVEPHYTSPDQVQQVPPYSRSHQPQIVVVDEDEDLNVDGKLRNSQNI